MSTKRIVIRLLALQLVGLVFSACAAKALRPGAERIIVTRQPAPKGCRFVGTVVGEQGGSFTGGWTSNKNLAQGATNDLKNKAFDLGGNYVVLETNTAGNTHSGSWGGFGGSMHGGQTDVTNTGNAYKCPPSVIGLD